MTWLRESYPRLMTFEQKRSCMTTSKGNLAFFNCHLNEFWQHFIEVQDINVDHNILETKQYSKLWVSLAKSVPKLTKVALSSKIKGWLVFWYARDEVYIAYFREKKRILCHFIGPDLKKKQNDWSRSVITKFNKRCYEMLQCQPYFSDVASSDWFSQN